MQHVDKHFVNRIGWLRASVLGANDGILSTTSIVIGVAAATPDRQTIILAALAGLVAGAMSMAAGEYVSVSSQADTEKADLEREKKELEKMPEEELEELTQIYEKRGLSRKLAKQVAIELTQNDALAAHARDELGITDTNLANPLQAAFSSFGSFVVGALLPLIVAIFTPVKTMIYYQYTFAILFLILLGAISAKTGGSNLKKSILRVAFWGTVAMVASALVGHFFGVDVN
mgnify:CR=1 FL=1